MYHRVHSCTLVFRIISSACRSSARQSVSVFLSRPHDFTLGQATSQHTHRMDTVDGQSMTTEVHVAAAGTDLQGQEKVDAPKPAAKLDIEHAVVQDDPRQWPKTRKYVMVSMISAAAMIAGLGANIYNRALRL